MSKRARRRVQHVTVTRADFVSRDTTQHHISGKQCDTCEHSAREHYSSAFQDCPVKRCQHSNCRCSQFVPSRKRCAKESQKSAQDQRAARYRVAYLYT